MAANAADRTPDVVVLSGNPDDGEVAALVLALAALAAEDAAPRASVSTLPTTWADRERSAAAPAGWASTEGRHLRRVA